MWGRGFRKPLADYAAAGARYTERAWPHAAHTRRTTTSTRSSKRMPSSLAIASGSPQVHVPAASLSRQLAGTDTAVAAVSRRDDGVLRPLRLVDSVVNTKGVILATYVPAGV